MFARDQYEIRTPRSLVRAAVRCLKEHGKLQLGSRPVSGQGYSREHVNTELHFLAILAGLDFFQDSWFAFLNPARKNRCQGTMQKSTTTNIYKSWICTSDCEFLTVFPSPSKDVSLTRS